MGKKGTAPITPIRLARLRIKKTQKQAAEQSGLTYRHYQRIEYWTTIPNVLIALRIKEVLGVSIEELWGDLLFDP